MHLIAWLTSELDDLQTSRALWQAGIEAIPISIYAVQPYPRAGLLLGFTALKPEIIDAKVRKLVQVIRSLKTKN